MVRTKKSMLMQKLVDRRWEKNNLKNQVDRSRIVTKYEMCNNTDIFFDNEENNCGEYIFLDISQLSLLINNMKCSTCDQVSLNFELGNGNGFLRKIYLKCDFCERTGIDGVKCVVDTSKLIECKHTKRLRPDINIRMSLASSYSGKGYAGLQKFCAIMNMQNYSKKTHEEYKKIIGKAIN